MERKICGIYCIENLVNGKKYIGQSIDVKRRFAQHKRSSNIKRNYFLYQSFEKYGIENFKFYTLEECDVDLLNDKEKYWIEYYNTYVKGYNMTLGGDCSKNKGSEKLRNKLPKNIEVFLKHNIDISVVIVELNQQLEIINEWSSVQSCARDTKLFATNISKCASLKYLSSNNRIFMYKTEVENLTPVEIQELRDKKRKDLNFCKTFSYKARSIDLIDDIGNIIETYTSAHEVANKLNLDDSSIIKICKGRFKQTKGYRFQYHVA